MLTRALVFLIYFLIGASSRAEFTFTPWPAAEQNHTHLLELVQGSPLSSTVSLLREGSLTLADGRIVPLSSYYSTHWTDARVTWLTTLSQNLGFIWGGSTGEKGDKYRIAPSLKFGFIYNVDLTPKTGFSVTATTIRGGRLKEKPCLVDYGPIRGEVEANCRLAASQMPPEETLQYLLDVPPFNKNRVVFTYSVKL
jgi:hypothetical protein